MQERAEKHFNKGADFAKLGELEKAIVLFDKALILEPGNDMVWVLRGTMLDELGRFEDALTSYDRALAIKPDYSVAWYNRGIVLRKLDRNADPAYADAKKHREQAAREEDKKRTH
jgi:tetratricopeptide (TPR) repeat protein